eukprot:gene3655-13731_t
MDALKAKFESDPDTIALFKEELATALMKKDVALKEKDVALKEKDVALKEKDAELTAALRREKIYLEAQRSTPMPPENSLADVGPFNVSSAAIDAQVWSNVNTKSIYCNACHSPAIPSVLYPM